MHSSPDIFSVIKSRRIRWARYVTRMINTYIILLVKRDGKRPFVRSTRRYEDNIKMDLKIGLNDVH